MFEDEDDNGSLQKSDNNQKKNKQTHWNRISECNIVFVAYSRESRTFGKPIK